MPYIEFRGEQHPLIIDFYVLKTICAKLKISMQEVEQIIFSPENSEKCIIEALKRGYKLENKTFNLSDADIDEFINEDGTFGDFVLIFNECITNIFTPKNKKKEVQQ